MIRKLLVTSAISIVPGEGAPQITFAFVISSFSLVLSMRYSPFIHHNLGQLHIMSLTSQCVTLFYALMLETTARSDPVQTSANTNSDKQEALGNFLLEIILIFLQISVFLLPMYLFALDKGLFKFVYSHISKGAGYVRKCLRMNVSKRNIFWHRTSLNSQYNNKPELLEASSCVNVGLVHLEDKNFADISPDNRQSRTTGAPISTHPYTHTDDISTVLPCRQVAQVIHISMPETVPDFSQHGEQGANREEEEEEIGFRGCPAPPEIGFA
jgi:hypothetical protein